MIFDHDKDYDGPTDREALAALRVLDAWTKERGLATEHAHAALIEVWGNRAPRRRRRRGIASDAIVAALAELKRGPRTLKSLMRPGLLDPTLARKHLADAGCTFEQPGRWDPCVVTGPVSK